MLPFAQKKFFAVGLCLVPLSSEVALGCSLFAKRRHSIAVQDAAAFVPSYSSAVATGVSQPEVDRIRTGRAPPCRERSQGLVEKAKQSIG